MFRLRTLFHKDRAEEELDDELRFHLEKQIEANIASGMTPDEARRAARREFGGVEQVKEECRDAWGVRFIETLLQDLRFGLRMLAKNPGFTVVAVLTLALGIGANTVMFSMVNGILLRPLPYDEPGQLYVVNEVVPQLSHYGPWFDVNSGNFLLWQLRCDAFSALAAIQPTRFTLRGVGEPRQIPGARVSAIFFSLLRIQPQLSRTFSPEEDEFGHDRKAILTHELWAQTFHSDPEVVGRAVNLDGDPYTIVGILLAKFRFPDVLGHTPQIFKPLGLADWERQPGIGNFNYAVIVRLKSGVNPQQALAQLNVVEEQIARKGDAQMRGAPGQYDLHAKLRPLKTVIAGSAVGALWTLVAAAGLVLLLICVNLTNLMLAKNTGRAHELAVRSAVGATRRRLGRQMLTEVMILAAAGGGLGLLFAHWGLKLLVRNAPLDIPRVDEIQIQPPVLWFTLGVSVATGLIFGLLPTLRLARVEPVEAVKSAGPTMSGARADTRLRSALVVAEIALCGVLVAGALLLVQSLARVVRDNQWLKDERVLAVDLIAPRDRYTNSDQREPFFSRILDQIKGLPGVLNAGFVNKVPLLGQRWGDAIEFREEPRAEMDVVIGDFRFVSPDYFRTIGIPLVKGRLFSANDRGKDAAIISESLARGVLPGRDPIGMHLVWQDKPREVIGVVGDVRIAPDKPPALVVYLPLWSFNEPAQTLVVRTAVDPGALAPLIRRAIWNTDSQVAIPRMETLNNVVDGSTATRRYVTLLGTLFAFCALLLAAIGLYGVVSYSAAQRTREIGVRVALGARRNDVTRLVLAQGFKLTLAGLGIGIIGALLLTRVLASQLYGVKPTDPLTFVAVSALLTAVALVACFIPARRATKVEPMEALRYE